MIDFVEVFRGKVYRMYFVVELNVTIHSDYPYIMYSRSIFFVNSRILGQVCLILSAFEPYRASYDFYFISSAGIKKITYFLENADENIYFILYGISSYEKNKN